MSGTQAARPQGTPHAHGELQANTPLRSMVVMHVPANAGFAIAPLESLFAALLLELAGQDRQAVHFAYPTVGDVPPQTLPDGVRFMAFDTGNGQDPDDVLAAYAKAHRIDLVLFFDKQPVSPLHGKLRRAGVRCLLSYWGAEISSPNPWWRLLLKRLQVALSQSRLDGLIFESHAMAKLATHGRGVPAGMVDVVPLGVDISRFSPVRTDYAHRVFSIDPSKRIIVYAGHMEARKGVATLVRAAAELLDHRQRSDVCFLIFGNRPGESDQFQPLMQGANVTGNLIFAGYRPDLHLCFPGCFAGVIPSVGWDSFPRTSVELAACALPLVVSRLGGLPECVVEGETGLIFPPGDHIALANHLESLLDDPARATLMGSAGRSRCERELTIEVQSQRLRNVLGNRLHIASAMQSRR